MTAISRTILALALAGFASACASRPVAHPPSRAEQHFTGRVVHADGRAASGAVIIVTDPVKGDVLSMVRVSEDGTFVTSLRRTVYSVTATAAEQSVYVPSSDGSGGPVEIRLEANCHPFNGRIRTEAPLPNDAIVRLSRVSDFIGDTFGAVVAADGTFRACIPDAMYGVKPPDGFVTRNAYVVIPYPRMFDYRTDLLRDADLHPADLSGITPDSVDAFVAAFPASTRVLALGESNHGTREFYEERTALAKRLATNHGVRLLMLEAGYGEVLALDDYVNGAAIDIEHAVQELGYWIYDTRTFLQILADLRAYNTRLPTSKRIRVIGTDVQNTAGAIKYLQHHGAALSQSATVMLDKLAADRGKAWTGFTPADRAAVRAALGRIAAMRETGTVSSKVNRTALAARSLLFRFDMWEAPDQAQLAEIRDEAMARMALDVLAVEPQSRATLWAHLAHVAREYNIGKRTMGAHLAAALGDSYRAYGLLALAGSARAWDMKQEIGVIASTLQTPPAHGLEAVLAARSNGAPVTYWTFANATGDAARWLRGVHALRTFGSIFMGKWEIEYWDLQSFDGVVLFESVSPTDPTPTGERRATPKPE